MGITQYYSILHGYYNITQYYIQYWVVFNSIILNIASNITQYHMDITILLNITCNMGSIHFHNTQYCIQYYSILHGHNNITQYQMQYRVVFNSILLNITYNITQYYMPNHTILLNITCVLGSIQFNIRQYSLCFIDINQYYM